MNTLYRYKLHREQHKIQWHWLNHKLDEFMMISPKNTYFPIKHLSTDYLNNCIKILEYK